jgi:hypothetical protein
MKISLRGNKSITAVFDSQVVRLDVSVREWSGWMSLKNVAIVAINLNLKERNICYEKNRYCRSL